VKGRVATLAVALASVLGGGALASAARAQEAQAPALRPLCPDRPSKGTAVCTVDAGHWQIESDILNETHDVSGAVTTDAWLYTNPTLKLGLTDSFDIEANIAPYVRVRTHGPAAGAVSTVSGAGDLYLRAKLNLAGNAGGAFGLALEPYVKAPTARLGVGNGEWEGGLLIPAAFALPGGWSLGLAPEADVLANASGSGQHLALSLPVGLGHAVGPFLGTVELWAQEDFDPAGSTRQYSLDFAAAWVPPRTPDVQFDAGVNFGLNRAAPDAQVYFGVARRF